jgi:hypothetical protein
MSAVGGGRSQIFKHRIREVTKVEFTGPYPAGKPVIQSEGLNARGAKNPLPMKRNNWIGKLRIDKMENQFAGSRLNIVLFGMLINACVRQTGFA